MACPSQVSGDFTAGAQRILRIEYLGKRRPRERNPGSATGADSRASLRISLE